MDPNYSSITRAGNRHQSRPGGPNPVRLQQRQTDISTFPPPSLTAPPFPSTVASVDAPATNQPPASSALTPAKKSKSFADWVTRTAVNPVATLTGTELHARHTASKTASNSCFVAIPPILVLSSPSATTRQSSNVPHLTPSVASSSELDESPAEDARSAEQANLDQHHVLPGRSASPTGPRLKIEVNQHFSTAELAVQHVKKVENENGMIWKIATKRRLSGKIMMLVSATVS